MQTTYRLRYKALHLPATSRDSQPMEWQWPQTTQPPLPTVAALPLLVRGHLFSIAVFHARRAVTEDNQLSLDYTGSD